MLGRWKSWDKRELAMMDSRSELDVLTCQEYASWEKQIDCDEVLSDGSGREIKRERSRPWRSSSGSPARFLYEL